MSSEILNALDALAVSMFIDIGQQIDQHGDLEKAESYYKSAVRAAETIYGAYHGETGMVLMRLAAFYKRNARCEEATVVEKRIVDIEAIYLADQSA